MLLGGLLGCERAALPLQGNFSGRVPVSYAEQPLVPETEVLPVAPLREEPAETQAQEKEALKPPPEPALNALLEGPSKAPIRVTSPFHERGPAPLTVVLHGSCGEPKITCGWFQDGDMEATWQVCPAGNSYCGRNAYEWSISPAPRLEKYLSGGLARVRERYGERISEEGAVLVGFSLGAFAAVSLLSSGTHQFAGVVLVGASVAPTAEQITSAGVARIALVAGDFDSSAPAMQRAAAALKKQGIRARFVSLGQTGHFFPDSTSAPIGRVIDWARGLDHAGSPAR